MIYSQNHLIMNILSIKWIDSLMEYKVFGCKVNKFYVNKWINHFNDKCFSDDKWVLIASCVVTDRAKSKWLKDVRFLLKSWKNVYLTWCWSLEKWDKMDYDMFYGIYPELKCFDDRLILLWESPVDWTFLWEKIKRSKNMDNINESINNLIQDYDLEMSDENNLFTKKFIVIQNWCDTNCTFCLTIKKRWSSSSRSEKEIIEEIDKFVDLWWKEIVITWINLASWGCTNTRRPEQSRFYHLLEQIIKKTNIQRIRLSSLWPEFLDNRFFDIVKDVRFMPHFHISVQSFSDKILKLMNRNYNKKKIEDVFIKLKTLTRQDKILISVWADIIVGFPWEGKMEFEETYDAIRQFEISKLHIFPFSSHSKGEWVPAWKFVGQITQSEIKNRVQILEKLWDDLREEFVKQNKWTKLPVLVEWIKWDKRQWWTPNYIQMDIIGDYSRWTVIDMVI